MTKKRIPNMNMKLVKLSEVFELYGSYFIAKYHASIEKGIIIDIEKRMGKPDVNASNSFLYIRDILAAFRPQLEEDYKNLTEYHNQEILMADRSGFLGSFLNKDKKDKLKYHEDRLRELRTIYNSIKYYDGDESKLYKQDNNFYNMYVTDLKKYDYLNVVDLRNKENINMEIVCVDELIPFIDNDNNISIKLKLRAFSVDKCEIVNLQFTNNYFMPEKDYHIFNIREKAYDFMIEELMKNEYNDNIKMRLNLAKRLDSTFG